MWKRETQIFHFTDEVKPYASPCTAFQAYMAPTLTIYALN